MPAKGSPRKSSPRKSSEPDSGKRAPVAQTNVKCKKCGWESDVPDRKWCTQCRNILLKQDADSVSNAEDTARHKTSDQTADKTKAKDEKASEVPTSDADENR